MDRSAAAREVPVSSAPVPPSSAGPARRRLDVQGLRAVAVLLVVAFHAGLPVPGGFTGVDVFFVISGFVITGLVLREDASAGGFRLGRFYARRVRRLLPALAVMVGTVAFASVVLQAPAATAQTARTGIAAVVSLANLELYRSTGGYFDSPAEINPLLHTWSLSVEEQFYLAFPVLLLAGLRWGRRLASLRPAVVLLVAAGLLSLLAAEHLVDAIATSGDRPPGDLAFYGSPTRAWEFLSGAVVALAAGRLRRLPARAAAVLAGAGVVLLLLAAALLDGRSGVPGLAALLPVLGTAAVLTAGTAASGTVVTKLLGTRPLVWIGDRSYSLYLWHWPLIVAARLLAPSSTWATLGAATLSILPAWASYRLVEEPIRSGARLPRWPAWRLVAAATAGCAFLCTVPAAGAHRWATSGDLAAFTAATTAFHEDRVRGCERAPSPRRPPASSCVTGPTGAARTVYLVGDSQAGMWSEAVLGAATSLGWRTVVATAHRCPWVVADPAHGCPDPDSTFAWLAAQPPGVVVLAVEADSYVNGSAVTLGPRGSSRQARGVAWAAALDDALVPLVRHGHRILLVSPTPRFLSWRPLACPGPVARTQPDRCGASVARSAAQDRRAVAVAAERDVARVPGIATLDLFDAFCGARRCATNVGSRWLARDGDHVTVTASADLAPVFRRRLAHSDAW